MLLDVVADAIAPVDVVVAAAAEVAVPELRNAEAIDAERGGGKSGGTPVAPWLSLRDGAMGASPSERREAAPVVGRGARPAGAVLMPALLPLLPRISAR